MTTSVKFKEMKKMAIMAGLAIMGINAPLKVQSAEATAEKEPTRTAEVSTAQKQRQQLFESAVRANRPKEEIAQYMDFPEFLPVDKNGQFDDKKAEEWAQKLAPYMKTLAEKGQTMSAADAYKAFKAATGQKDVSLEDFTRLCDIVQKAADEHHSNTDIPAKVIPPLTMLVAGFIALSATTGVGYVFKLGIEDVIYNIKNYKKRKSFDEYYSLKNTIGRSATTMAQAGIFAGILGFVAAGAGFGAAGAAYGTAITWTEKPEKAIYRMYGKTYESYVDQTIQSQQKVFENAETARRQQEWEQVKKSLGGKTN